MKKFLIPGLGIVVVAALAYVTLRPQSGEDRSGASTPEEGAAIVSVSLPDELSSNASLGKNAYDAVCADCHGENAAGKEGFGPPLVHKIYEPSHHSDRAFIAAAQNGVRSHHWDFGNMPPVEGFTQGDVKMVVAYVRELQRANGIE
ncbi:MAG: cytochrome c [Martelella sp.]